MLGGRLGAEGAAGGYEARHGVLAGLSELRGTVGIEGALRSCEDPSTPGSMGCRGELSGLWGAAGARPAGEARGAAEVRPQRATAPPRLPPLPPLPVTRWRKRRPAPAAQWAGAARRRDPSLPGPAAGGSEVRAGAGGGGARSLPGARHQHAL